MRIAYFTHSLESCWNHGNAHFLRGVLSELSARGHHVEAFEPEDSWSRANLVSDHGEHGLAAFFAAYPELRSTRYAADANVAQLVDGADLVIVHEWNNSALVASIGRLRSRGGPFTLLFHDTHHRAVSAPEEMRAYDLEAYDGVLAFGGAIAEIYRKWGWADRAFIWHEAADTRRFHPPAEESERDGLVWIGNWGDGERSAEIVDYLLLPARSAGLPLDVYGVRYPSEGLHAVHRLGAHYRGWLPNAAVPEIFGRYLATVHVPRRYYAEKLPGIPTIRMFEALACGIPLMSAPWDDCEGLFRVGKDFLMVRSKAESEQALKKIANDSDLRQSLAESGLETIRAHHTCAHRADELLAIAARIEGAAERSAA